jgi:hypothetical protein
MVQHVSTSLIGQHYAKHIFVSLGIKQKRVQPYDDLLIMSKHAAPLNTSVPSCIECSCAVTHTGVSQHLYHKTLLPPSNDRVLDCENLDPWGG